jgi:hypothetical protein
MKIRVHSSFTYLVYEIMSSIYKYFVICKIRKEIGTNNLVACYTLYIVKSSLKTSRPNDKRICYVFIIYRIWLVAQMWTNPIRVLLQFLGAFAKFRKATISVVMSVCLSVPRHGTTRLPLDGFSLNLIFEDFWKCVEKNSSFIKIWQEKRVLKWRPIYIYDISFISS